MSATIAERVAAGAAYLDKHEPDWVDRIDLDKLDLASPCRCVLGQLETARAGESWDAFCEAVDRLGFVGNDTARLGFDRAIPGAWNDYGLLTAAWRELIQARRGGAA